MNNTGIIAAGAMIMIGLLLSGLVKSEGEYGMSGRFTLHELSGREVRAFDTATGRYHICVVSGECVVLNRSPLKDSLPVAVRQ